MSLVKQLFLILFLSLTLGVGSLYAQIELAVDQGYVEVQAIGRGPTKIKDFASLKRGDRISLPENSTADLHFSTGVGGTLGEKTVLTLEQKDVTGWEKLYLFSGCIRVFGGTSPIVVKTPSTEIFVFHGATDIYVHQGVTLVIPSEEQGAMVSSSKEVAAVKKGELGILNQKGELKRVRKTLPKPEELLKRKGSVVKHPLSHDYLLAMFEHLNIREVPDTKIQRKIIEENKFRIYFVSPRDALEQITKIYYDHTKDENLLEDGMDLVFAQELFRSRDYKRIIPDDLIPYYVMGDKLKNLFIKLRMAEKELAKFDPRQVRIVMSIFRTQLVNRILPKDKVKPKFSFSLREVLAYNSNVTQTPDGQQSVSENDDFTATTILGLSYRGKPRNIGQATFKLGYTDIAHFDKDFETREFTSLNFSMKDKYKFKGGRLISSLTPQLSYAKNYLHTATGRVNAFDTMTPQFQMVYKKIKDSFAWSDYIIMIHTFGVELRDYRGSSSRDFRGKKKDIVAPFMTYMLLNLHRFDSHMAKTSVILNTKFFDSQSNELDYKNYRLTLNHAVVLPRITFDFNYGYSMREQPVYLFAGKRSDDNHSFGFGGKIKVLKAKGTLGVNFKRTVQDSNQSNFDYNSNQSSVYFSYRF